MWFYRQLNWHDGSPLPIERRLTVLFTPSHLQSSVSFTPFARGCSTFLVPALEHFKLLSWSNLLKGQKIPAFFARRLVCRVGELDCLMEWSSQCWSQYLLISSPTSPHLLSSMDCRMECKGRESGAQVQALLLNLFLFNLPNTMHEACSRASTVLWSQ